MMKKLFTLLLTAACFTATAQIEVEYPYNPDNQNDGHVGIEDILEILTVYGEEFTPEQLMVEGTSLTEWIQLLSETVIQQQAQIDSLESSIQLPAVSDSLINDIYDLIAQQQTVIDSVVQQPLGSFSLGLAVDPPWPDFEGGSSVYWEEGTWDNDVWLEGVTGNVNSGWAYYYTPTEDGFLMGRAYTRFFIQQIDQNGAERPIVNIYSVPDAPSFCVPLVKGVNYRVIRQSTLFDLSWTPILASESQSSSDDSQSAGSLGPCQGEFTVNYHGYDYELVEIGDQCWFAENLRTEYYQNGDPIDLGLPAVLNPTSAYMPAGNAVCGCVYNKAIVYDGRHACPNDFHIPTALDFSELLGTTLGLSLLNDSPTGFNVLFGYSSEAPYLDGNNCGVYNPWGNSWSNYSARFLTSTLKSFSSTSDDFPDGDPDEYFDFMIFETGPSDYHFSDLDNYYGQYIRCIKD